MDYRTGTCTKCYKELQIPNELDDVICMYCGHKMPVTDAVGAHGTSQESIGEFEISSFIKFIDHDKSFNQLFSKKNYEPAFHELYSNISGCLDVIAHQYIYCDSSKEEYIQGIASALIDYEQNKVRQYPKNKVKPQLLEDSAYVSIFLVPAIDYHKSEASDKLAEAIINGWRQNFKDHQINRGSFDNINDGFRKRRLCYITTAVCRSLGKPDDCYELTVLREFRDKWLLVQEDGPVLIDEYYESAGRIVTGINHRIDASKVYQDIYQTYIEPCVRLIEQERYEACKDLYKTMVRTLLLQCAA